MKTSSLTKIDLHCHTTHSDGKDTPEILVQKAKQAGLQMVAVTDHDRVNREARELLAEA